MIAPTDDLTPDRRTSTPAANSMRRIYEDALPHKKDEVADDSVDFPPHAFLANQKAGYTKERLELNMYLQHEMDRKFESVRPKAFTPTSSRHPLTCAIGG